jgi:hypothetical protein
LGLQALHAQQRSLAHTVAVAATAVAEHPARRVGGPGVDGDFFLLVARTRPLNERDVLVSD